MLTEWAEPRKYKSQKVETLREEIDEFYKKIKGVKDGTIIPDKINAKRELESLNSEEMEEYIEKQVQIQIENMGLSDEDIKERVEANKMAILTNSTELGESIEIVKEMTKYQQNKMHTLQSALAGALFVAPLGFFGAFNPVLVDPKIFPTVIALGLAAGAGADVLKYMILTKANPEAVERLKKAGIYDELMNEGENKNGFKK